MSGAISVGIACGSTGPLGELVHAQRLAEHMADRDIQVSLWALGGSDRTLPRPGAIPVSVVPVAVDASIEGRAEALANAIATDGPPEVLVCEDVVSGLAAARLRTSLPAMAIVRTIHHLDAAHELDSQEHQRLSVDSADRCVCVSEYWAARVREELGLESEVIPNGVDHARFAAPALNRRAARERLGWGDRPVIVSVGGVGARKGSIALVEAFARARARIGADAMLAIVGGRPPTPEYLDRFLDEAARLSVTVARARADDSAALLLMETQPEDAMPALYRAADAFALPSSREGFGLAALEAAASGLPIVISRLAVFRERFHEGEDCLMVSVGDSGELADALVRAVRDSELAARLGSAAQVTASALTWSSAASSYARLVREVVAT